MTILSRHEEIELEIKVLFKPEIVSLKLNMHRSQPQPPLLNSLLALNDFPSAMSVGESETSQGIATSLLFSLDESVSNNPLSPIGLALIKYYRIEYDGLIIHYYIASLG